MKILVVSLLRLGDIVLGAPAMRDLKARYPDAQIHLLINSQFRQIAGLLPYVERVIEFDRETIQKGLGDASVPMFEAYARVEGLIDSLNSEDYDLMINLTHSRLSGWLCSLIGARERQGLVFDAQGRASFGSNWFRYLNNQVDADGREAFHFSDVFRFAVGADDEGSARGSLFETTSGKAESALAIEAMGGVNSDRPIVALQALTNDEKKNWSLPRFQRSVELIAAREPKARFAILGAPFEREKLEATVASLRERGVEAHLTILSLEGVYRFLKKTDLLVTGDTSVKHLACAAGTKVLEIAIGSSDAFRTGAFAHGSVIVRGKETCAPCTHSKDCFRESHACAARVAPEAIAMIATELLRGRQFQLASIAREYEDEIEILQVDARHGYWAAHSPIEPFTEESVVRWIDLTCRKLWLQGGLGTLSDRTGTEIVKLEKLMRSIHPAISDIEWKHLLSDLERQVAGIEARLNGLKTGVRHLHGHFEDPRRLQEFVRQLISFRERMKAAAALKTFRTSLDLLIEDDISPPFVRVRRISDAVHEIEARVALHLKVLRALGARSENVVGMEKT